MKSTYTTTRGKLGRVTRRSALRIVKSDSLAIFVLVLASMLVTIFSSNGYAQKWLPASSSLRALVVPEPMNLKWKISESFKLTATTVIVLPTSSSQEERDIAVWLKKGFHTLWGTDPEIMVTDFIPEQNAIIIGIAKDKGMSDLAPSLLTGKFGTFPGHGYVLSVTPRRVCLVGVDIDGLRYGAQTLIQATCQDSYIASFVIPAIRSPIFLLSTCAPF